MSLTNTSVSTCGTLLRRNTFGNERSLREDDEDLEERHDAVLFETPTLKRAHSNNLTKKSRENSPPDDSGSNDPEDEESKYRRTKSNSTSSLYINSTMRTPDMNAVVRSMGQAMFYHLEKGHQSPKKILYDIFNEDKHPISKKRRNTVILPSPDDVCIFLNKIFVEERLPVEIGILAFVYVERLISKAEITIHASNYRRIILGALILACKVWEDKAVWNIDFLSLFANAELGDLNTLENSMLFLLNYDVEVTGQLYAKYYFELRSLAENENHTWQLKPLDKEAAQRLEELSHEQAKIAKRGSRRANSSGALVQGVSRHVLN